MKINYARCGFIVVANFIGGAGRGQCIMRNILAGYQKRIAQRAEKYVRCEIAQARKRNDVYMLYGRELYRISSDNMSDKDILNSYTNRISMYGGTSQRDFYTWREYLISEVEGRYIYPYIWAYYEAQMTCIGRYDAINISVERIIDTINTDEFLPEVLL